MRLQELNLDRMPVFVYNTNDILIVKYEEYREDEEYDFLIDQIMNQVNTISSSSGFDNNSSSTLKSNLKSSSKSSISKAAKLGKKVMFK